MIVSTYYTNDTYKARIHEQLPAPLKVGKILYSASCTAGEDQAAKACVVKWYGAKAAESLIEVKEQDLNLSEMSIQSRSLRLRFWQFRY